MLTQINITCCQTQSCCIPATCEREFDKEPFFSWLWTRGCLKNRGAERDYCIVGILKKISSGFRGTMADDYYAILGVSRGATADEIQKAYRKLARKHHPDLHAEKSDKEKKAAKEKFQKIQRAYDVLNDPEKRKMYDQFGPGFDSMGGGAGPQFHGAPFGEAEIDFSQIFGGRAPGGKRRAGGGFGFEEILRQFGAGSKGGQEQFRPGPQKGNDVEREITVSFHTAIMGGRHQVHLERRNGKVDNITVQIPPGIEDKKRIRLRGQGEMGLDGGPRGDLLIKVRVAPHPHYSRQGKNLHVTLPISLAEATHGARIDVPTPAGVVTVTVPKASSSGKTLRLRGLGIKSPTDSGDLLVRLQIQIPENISPSDTDLIDKLSPAWSDNSFRRDVTW
jgi:DnaJ-class molecular chaperone